MDQSVTTPLTGSDFFVAGGTLPLQSESYIERAADQQILASLESGRFCYVLNSRQMGKSSLCVRTMSRLTEKGIRCAFIDITKLGGRNVTPEQWYAGMALEIGRSTGLRKEILEYWKAEASVGPMQRFFGALRHVVLTSSQDRFVIFVDEIDSTRSLPFNTDEFFAGVRECFNRRVQEQEFERLTFCFLGVAVPSDLMKDARTTPFNIGDRIYLRDFKLEEALPLAQHLGPQGKAVLERVHHWTNGHPFLTQSICRALMQHEAPTVAAVDEMIQRDLLEPKVRETNINLSDVGNRVLNGYADGDDVDEFRANILSAYHKALIGKEQLVDDESNRVTAVLKLSGLMRSEGKQLLVRNRIYEHVFGKEWIEENMPEQEVRRQRSAYTRGVIRTALIAASIIGLIGFLAISNFSLRKKAEETARLMSWRSYVSDMNRLPVVYEQNNTRLMEELLARHENDKWRGPEWDYWNGRINDAIWKGPRREGPGWHSIFPSQDRFLFLDDNTAYILDAKSGAQLDKFELPPMGPSSLAVLWDGRTLVRANTQGYLYDLIEKKIIRRIPKNLILFTLRSYWSRDGRYALGRIGDEDGVIDTRTMQFVQSWKTKNGAWYFGILPDSKTVVRAEQVGNSVTVRWYDIASKRVVREWKDMKNVWEATFPNAEWVTVTYSDGWLRRFRLADRKLLWEIRLGEDTLAGPFESQDGSMVTATTAARTGYLVKIENNKPRLVRRFSDAGLITLSADGKYVFPTYRQIRAYDTASAGTVVERQLPNFLGDVGYYPRSDDLVAFNSNLVTILKFENGEFKTRHVDSDAKSISLWRAPEPMLGATLVADGKMMRLVDISTKRTLARFEGKANQERVLVLNNDQLLFSSDSRTYELVDMKTGLKKPGFRLEFDTIPPATCLSTDEDAIAMGGTEGSVVVVDARTLKVRWSAKVHRQGVTHAKFSRDGSLLVTSSGDDTAIVWDAKSGKVVSRLRGHAQTVKASDFLPGNSRVVTASDDKTIRLWDVQTGTELTTVGSVGDTVTFCMVSKDQKYILAGNQTGLLRAWPLFGTASKSP